MTGELPMTLDWFDLALLKMFAVGVVLALASSWRGWGRLLKEPTR